MNRWKIPDWLGREVRDRDRNCVYCRIEFGAAKETRKSLATWEHIVNDARLINRENIARCCFSCNSSKGTKKLSDWLESVYCQKRGITKGTVAEVVKRALAAERGVLGPNFVCTNCELLNQARLHERLEVRGGMPVANDIQTVL